MSKIEKVKAWVKEHKEVILGVCATVLGGAAVGYINYKIGEKRYDAGFIDGRNKAIDLVTGGMDPNKTARIITYEYAGYGEFHDCDDESAEKFLEFAKCDEDNVKTIRDVIFVEVDKRTF